MRYHLTAKSANVKTGKIPVSTTSSDSCPATCPLKDKGCYASLGHLGMHWKQVDKQRGTDFDTFCESIAALPDNQLWRHNQAGDLPGNSNRINVGQLRQLTQANAGKNGFTYTHKPLTANNEKAIREANDNGFTINLSANGLHEVDGLMGRGLPVVTILPLDAPKVTTTKSGHKVVTCPAQLRDTNCKDCGLCQQRNRSFAIGFIAHGSKTNQVNLIAKG
ncbi:hypothetical protein OAA60_00885 [Porticoccaceae bacterium]|nr:hypothetical protein [Porticoccaceae bacterium]